MVWHLGAVGNGAYGSAAGAQGRGRCRDGCGDCEGDGGEGGKWSNTFTALLAFIFILRVHQ